MENKSTPIELLVERAENYGKASVEVYRLKAIGKTADVVSALAAQLVLVLVFTLFFLVLNIGVALWIGALLGNAYYGFFIVSGGYALAGGAIYIFRDKWIRTPVKNSIITQALN